MNIPNEAVEAALEALDEGTSTWDGMRLALEAAAPHLMAAKAVSAVLGLHREMPCLDEDGDPIGGSYCEECKDLDDHSGERVHEVYPCMTVREITKAFTGQGSYAAMRDKIEGMAK